MKYYFITYQATNRQGSISIWNQVIKGNPMKFIKHVQSVEESENIFKQMFREKRSVDCHYMVTRTLNLKFL